MKTPIPLDVPLEARAEYYKNYMLLTKGTGKLFLFSADHKIEHLDKDFVGPQIPPEAHLPEHLFKIAHEVLSGGMATQLGLIARYGPHYPKTTYVVKLNSKTSLVTHQDPMSRLLWTVSDVIRFQKDSKLTISAIGITVYLGSAYEDLMLEQAAQAVLQAHQHGLLAIIWMYPRGSAIKDPMSAELLAGATGVAACLGADFVKIHPPAVTQIPRAELLKTIVEAAGNTKVLLAGGAYVDASHLIAKLREDMDVGGISGMALGRSIFQHSLKDAVEISHAVAQHIYKKPADMS